MGDSDSSSGKYLLNPQISLYLGGSYRYTTLQSLNIRVDSKDVPPEAGGLPVGQC